jgi:hypothetical protein
MKVRRRATLAAGLVAWLVAAAASALLTPAHAALPAAYKPMVIEAVGLPERAEFDLGPALQRAQREHKSLYVYLGARDCAFCRKYEAFLAANAAELVPHFTDKYIVVDLRSALLIQAPRLFFRRGNRSLGYVDFMRELGDERERQLVYPSVWLLDGAARPLMPMPAGTGTFETVAEQLEILRLEQ